MSVRLGTVATLITDADDLGQLPLVALESVEAGTGTLTAKELPEVSRPLQGVATARFGDVLFGKLRPYLAKTWHVDHPVYASTELMCLRPRPGIDGAWLGYVAASKPLVEWAVATSDGAKMPRTSWERLRQFRLDVPSIDEQRAIADYLDRETARIERLVAGRNAQARRLRERIAALLQGAIDDARTVEMPLRRVVRRFVDYRGATPTKAESGIPLVTATNISDGRIDLSLGEQFVTEKTYREWMRRGFPEEGDVLLTTEAPLGEVAAIADTRVALAQRLILLKPNERATPEYLRLVLMSSRVRADLLSRASGSTVWGIRADRLRDVRVPVPDLRAQRDIVVLMAEAEDHLASAQGLLSHHLGLLAERRQALITAAVTGELQVPVLA